MDLHTADHPAAIVRCAAPIVAAIEPCPPLEALRRDWQMLEAQAESSFFLSWSWVGTLAAEFGCPPLRLAARRDGVLVGLALLGAVAGRPWDILRRPSLHLNETGDPACDGVMIEYNGILARRDEAEAVEAACLAALRRAVLPGRWREVHLGGIGPALADTCARSGPVRLLRRYPAPYADLAAGGGADPLDGLGSSTRRQIRRAMRLYAERGPLVLERAGSAAEALDWLDALEALHTPYWQARGRPGAFASDSFRRFHRRLIAESYPLGGVEVLRASAGGEAIGYLYNFRHHGDAYAYQSGFRYEADAKLKPGLVTHLLAMRQAAAEGLRRYCFLAGDSRYKRNLASCADDLTWLALQRDGLATRIEAGLRRWAARRPRAAAAAEPDEA